MKERTESIRSITGDPLHLTVWEPEGEDRGCVNLVHGLGEHCGRYRHVAEHLTSHGLLVYGADLLGFGRSGGRRGDVPSAEVHLADIHAVQELADRRLPSGASRMILGHSMGGLIALAFLQTHPGVLKQAIISAPAVNVARGVSFPLRAAARLLRVVAPGFTLANGLKPEDLCTDPAVVEAYIADPLVHDRASSRLYFSLKALGDRVRGEPHRFSEELELLLMHGEEDRICHAEDTKRLFARLPCERKSLELFPGMFHEILNERQKDRVLERIDAFFAL